MRKYAWGFLAWMVGCGLVWADASVWKVSKGDRVMYMGGTCHLLRDADYPLPHEFYRAYQAADLLVFETDIGALESEDVAKRMMAAMTYPTGQSLADKVSASTLTGLRGYCDSNGIPARTLLRYKPGLVVTTLVMAELRREGASEVGVDQFFFKRGKTDGKPYAMLETVDQQIGFLARMGEGDEDEFIRKNLEDMAGLEQQFGDLVAAWRVGDLKQMDDQMNREMREKYPSLHKQLLTDRNQQWLPKLLEFAQTPAVEFVLVGAGHLAGADGLLEALKHAGYTVERPPMPRK